MWMAPFFVRLGRFLSGKPKGKPPFFGGGVSFEGASCLVGLKGTPKTKENTHTHKTKKEEKKTTEGGGGGPGLSCTQEPY